jgi:type VI secretion system protein ImpG
VFGKYYQDELAFLRELGREFAQAYPALAPMLADRGGDPDVERLLEGVAFLTGRIREKLDDELPEVVHAIARLLFPQLLRPLPSATILELTPLPNVLREPHLVKVGTEFASIPVDGTRCLFRSTAPCVLTPWTIEDVRLETGTAGKQQLRVELRLPSGMPIPQATPPKLRLHLGGETRSALALLAWMHRHVEDVAVTAAKASRFEEREVKLGREAIESVGFAEDEALLPYPRTTFEGYRYLAEYHALPAKFAFIDVVGVERAATLEPESSRIALVFRFDAPLPPEVRITRDSIRLHCVPIVNIFPVDAEPIRLDPRRERFPLRISGLPRNQADVYSIEKVEAIGRGAGRRVRLGDFYDFEHVGSSTGPHLHYAAHVEPSVIGEGSDVYMTFGSPEDAPPPTDLEAVSIELLATNRQLPGALRAGEISVATQTSPAMATFRNLTVTTVYVPTPIGRELQWRAIAHAAMNLRALTEPDVLRTMLNIYDFPGIVDRQAARATELRLQSIRDVRVVPEGRLYRGAAVRGVAIDVDVDDKGFGGEGDLFLFGAILDRLFASYVSLNSFSRTTLTGVGTKAKYEWPARSGNLSLL